MKARIRRRIIRGLGLALGSGLLATLPAVAQEVELVDPTGSTRLTGVLLSFENGAYELRTDFGVVVVQASLVSCTGPGCPQPEATGVLVPSPDAARQVVEALGVLAETPGRQLTTAGAETVLTDADGTVLAALRPSEGGASLSADGLDDTPPPPRSNGIVAVVSRDAPIHAISIDRLEAIVRGDPADWSILGAPAGPLRLVFDAEALPPVGGLLPAPSGPAAISGSQVIIEVSRDPSAIGILLETSLPPGGAEAVGLRMLDLDLACGLRVGPTPADLRSGVYPLAFQTLPSGSSAGGFMAELTAQLGQLRPGALGGAAGLMQPVAREGNHLSAALGDLRDPNDMADLARLFSDIKGALRLSPAIPFPSNASVPDDISRAELAVVIDMLGGIDWGRNQLILNGFEDDFESGSRRVGLSRSRAETVRNLIIEAIAPPGSDQAEPRIRTAGYAGLAPRACNIDGEGRALNRRVEVWVKPLP